MDLWVRSSAPNVDLQATISEVRPDGKETFVQGGWVRTNARALDAAKSTELEPVLSLREEDFAPMPADQFVPVTVPLYYEGHAYRAGSRIRVRISAPNGDQPIWSFSETEPAGTAEVEIGYGDGMPSRLVLPMVPAGDVPDQLPPCPGLRGEPCRDYVPFANDTSVLDGYPRPKAATPVYTPLVPAYKACGTPNRAHAAPLGHGSCSSPLQESPYLTVGTPDANGRPARSVGALRWGVQPGDPATAGDEADVRLNLDLTDVRRSSDLSDYTGDLNTRVAIQITDRRSGDDGDEPATVAPFEFSFPAPCSADPSSDDGRDLCHGDDRRGTDPGRRDGGRAGYLGAGPHRGGRRRPGRGRLDDGEQPSVRGSGRFRALTGGPSRSAAGDGRSASCTRTTRGSPPRASRP